jgi:O-methyltransferase involved in polyketide biosynthesis
MNAIDFIRTELAAAVARGARQCVVVGSRPFLREAFKCSAEILQVFAVDEQQPSDSQATFVPTKFASEPLGAALENSDFDKGRTSLFLWLGGVGYRTVDAALATFAFIASLPEGSGVVFDYAAERIARGPLTNTALGALSSRISIAGGSVRQLIQPQALAVMLGAIGFRTIVDLAENEWQANGGHLVRATV